MMPRAAAASPMIDAASALAPAEATITTVSAPSSSSLSSAVPPAPAWPSRASSGERGLEYEEVPAVPGRLPSSLTARSDSPPSAMTRELRWVNPG